MASLHACVCEGKREEGRLKSEEREMEMEMEDE